MNRELIAGKAYALDTVTLIYLLERNPLYFQQVSQIFKKIETGEISAIVSALLLTELLVPAYRAEDFQRAEMLINILSNYPHLDICPVNTDIAVRAAKLRAEFQLRTPDAIHAATALERNVQGIITNDLEFKKLSKLDIEIITLS